MTKTLLEVAYTSAVAHYKAARIAIFSELNAANPGADFDSLHHASSRALNLHVSSLGFAERVWAKNLAYEKSGRIPRGQVLRVPSRSRSWSTGLSICCDSVTSGNLSQSTPR